MQIFIKLFYTSIRLKIEDIVIENGSGLRFCQHQYFQSCYFSKYVFATFELSCLYMIFSQQSAYIKFLKFVENIFIKFISFYRFKMGENRTLNCKRCLICETWSYDTHRIPKLYSKRWLRWSTTLDLIKINEVWKLSQTTDARICSQHFR